MNEIINKEVLTIDSMTYITRMDYDRGSPSWWVRFIKDRKHISHCLFYDNRYIDGKEESLHYAQEWRDWELDRLISAGLFKPLIGGKKIPIYYESNSKRINNKSKVVGVYRYDCTYIIRTIRGFRTITTLSWIASWIEYERIMGKVKRIAKRRSFSIRKWGEEEARQLAIKARHKAEYLMITKINIKLRNEYINRKK